MDFGKLVETLSTVLPIVSAVVIHYVRSTKNQEEHFIKLNGRIGAMEDVLLNAGIAELQEKTDGKGKRLVVNHHRRSTDSFIGPPPGAPPPSKL